MDTSETKGLELAMRGGTYSPVTVTNHDTVGAAFLGVLALVLMIALLRERAQNRRLQTRLSKLSPSPELPL